MKAASLYVVVQILAYGLDLGVFVLLAEGAGLSPFVANLCAKTAAGCFAFFAHRHVTFDAAQDHTLTGQALRYGLLLLANSLASSALLAAFLTVIPSPVAAKVAADVILIVVSFSLSKTVVFHSAKAGHGR